MIRMGKKNLNLLLLTFVFLGCLSSSGCGGSGTGDNDFSITKYGFNLNYNGTVDLEKVQLKTDDLDEIIDLYQEAGDDLKYRDSLLIAEKFAQGLGANAFAQDNLNTLEKQGLKIANIKKTQIGLKKYGENINAVLIEYEITEGLINDIPLLYVSQLFIPNDKNIILMSFITEDKYSRSSASNMFKNIK